jgi:hypothetical protein
MTAPRRIAGVSIGVNKTGVLQTLTAAASSAILFDKWLSSQARLGVQVSSTCLTDQEHGSSITYRNVVDAVKLIVDQRSCDALFLYFCGHGVMRNPYEEHFLLSNVKDYDTEAVNLEETIRDAKHCGLAHVIIVYDACRTSAEGDLRRVGGKSVIKPNYKTQPGHVDVFMASGPDQSAYLIPHAKQAFFTGVLLDILNAEPPEIIEQYQPQSIYMIPSRRLEKLLYKVVPQLAGSMKPPFDQMPAIGAQSDPPECFAIVSPPAVGLRGGNVWTLESRTEEEEQPSPPPLLASDVVKWHADRLFRGGLGGDQMPEGLRKIERTTGFDEVAQMTSKAQGREGFETHTGFTVIGAPVKRAWTSNQRFREGWLEPDYSGDPGITHVRAGEPPWDVNPGTAIIEFEQGGGVVLGIMPGYVGTVVIRDGAIAALAFAPSRGAFLYESYKSEEQTLKERRAFATAAASVAQIQSLEGRMFAYHVRLGKAYDPSLGILAAYAYYLAEDKENVQSVLQWMSNTPVTPWDQQPPLLAPVPFDVMMLAGALNSARPPGGVASCCPLFSFGWSLLDRLEVALPDRIREAGKHRRPGLWAAFDGDGINLFLEALGQGEIL